MKTYLDKIPMYVASQFQSPRGKVPRLTPLSDYAIMVRNRSLRLQEIGALSSAMFVVLPINAFIFVVSMSTFLGRPLKDAIAGALYVLPHILKKFWSATPSLDNPRVIWLPLPAAPHAFQAGSCAPLSRFAERCIGRGGLFLISGWC